MSASETGGGSCSGIAKMGKKKAASAAGDFRCANARCPVTGRDKVNQRCAGCGAVWYCGRRCQKQHWRQSGGNHMYKGTANRL